MLSLSIAAVSAVDIFVDPENGNDNFNSGISELDAKKTINGAVTAPGVTNIILMNGKYNTSLDHDISITKDLTFTGQNQDQVILDAAGAQHRFFTVNSGFIVTFINITFQNGGNGAQLLGGAIWNDGGTINITNCTFINNTIHSANSGGAIHNTGGMLIDSCTFINNLAGVSAGAVYNDDGDNNIIRNSFFINNSARHGGAIDIVNGDNFEIINSTFVNNSATGIPTNAGGGAIRIHGYESSSNPGCNYFKIINCTFIDNWSNSMGGALSNWGNYTSVENSTFINSKATTTGGAIYNNGPNMNVTISTFTNNNADYGGGIFNDYSMTVNGNTMSGNSANSFEGGHVIYNNGTMGVLNLTYINNATIQVNNDTWIMLNATLTDDMGNNVTWQNISFVVNGSHIDNMNSIEGRVSLNYNVIGNVGDTIPVTGNYDGRGPYDIVIRPGLLYLIGNTPPINPPKIPPTNPPTIPPTEPPTTPPTNPPTIPPIEPPIVPPTEPPTPITHVVPPTEPPASPTIDNEVDDTNSAIAMKKTGMPIIAIIFLLLSIIGCCVYRKQE
jgi:hypothetical protein